MLRVCLTHIKVFRAFLVNEYKRRPGAARINSNAYHIMTRSRQKSLLLTEKNWSKAVVPGTNLVLSILVGSVAIDSRLQCPLCHEELNKTSISRTRFWYFSLLLLAVRLLILISRFCDEYYPLAPVDEDALGFDTTTVERNDVIGLIDNEKAEMRLFKNIHLYPKKEGTHIAGTRIFDTITKIKKVRKKRRSKREGTYCKCRKGWCLPRLQRKKTKGMTLRDKFRVY
jgi:hypothetical protein